MGKAIAIDFDGCLCANAYPEIGEPNWPVIRRAQAEQRAGAGLILWTCREDQLLQEAVAACEGWGLTFDAVNESLPDWIEAFKNRPRKVGASEYWDDKAARIPVVHQFFVGGPGDDSIELIEAFPNEDAALKPCPFCGSTHVVYERYNSVVGERWRCWCADCIAGIDPGYAQSWGTVRDMWNRRTMPPNPPLTLDELREMGGKSYWHVGLQEDSPPPHWNVLDPFYAQHIEDYGYGKRWLAYRYELEGGGSCG